MPLTRAVIETSSFSSATSGISTISMAKIRGGGGIADADCIDGNEVGGRLARGLARVAAIVVASVGDQHEPRRHPPAALSRTRTMASPISVRSPRPSTSVGEGDRGDVVGEPIQTNLVAAVVESRQEFVGESARGELGARVRRGKSPSARPAHLASALRSLSLVYASARRIEAESSIRIGRIVRWDRTRNVSIAGRKRIVRSAASARNRNTARRITAGRGAPSRGRRPRPRR